MYIFPPHQIRAIRTFNVAFVIINFPVTPMALLCNCGSVESLQLVLVGRIFLFGDSGVYIIYAFWSCFDLLVYLCVFYSSWHIWFLLVRVFSGLPPCVGYFF